MVVSLGKDLEGNSSGLCQILSEHLLGGTEENDKNRIAERTSDQVVQKEPPGASAYSVFPHVCLMGKDMSHIGKHDVFMVELNNHFVLLAI
jgi:hypothetical protein